MMLECSLLRLAMLRLETEGVGFRRLLQLVEEAGCVG
jgi:hypothetical protein